MRSRDRIFYLDYSRDPYRKPLDQLTVYLAEIGQSDLPWRRICAKDICQHSQKPCDISLLLCPRVRNQIWIIEIPGCFRYRSSCWVDLAWSLANITGLNVIQNLRSQEHPRLINDALHEIFTREEHSIFHGGPCNGGSAYYFRRDIYHALSALIPRNLRQERCPYCGFTEGKIFFRPWRLNDNFHKAAIRHRACRKYREYAARFENGYITDNQRACIDLLEIRQRQSASVYAARSRTWRELSGLKRLRSKSSEQIQRIHMLNIRWAKLEMLERRLDKEVRNLQHRIELSCYAIYRSRRTKEKTEARSLRLAKNRLVLMRKAFKSDNPTEFLKEHEGDFTDELNDDQTETTEEQRRKQKRSMLTTHLRELSDRVLSERRQAKSEDDIGLGLA